MLGIFLTTFILLSLAYAVLISFYFRGWKDSPETSTMKESPVNTRISVIIPARNEEHHLPKLLKAIFSQYYPDHLLEVIVVDDHSEDQTAAIAKSFKGVYYIDMSVQSTDKISTAYKKRAIETAIRHSHGELIVTTDADCEPGPYWLLSLAQAYEHTGAQMLAGPVAFRSEFSLFSQFQSLDFMTMQGITAAVLHFKIGTMCNGANLAYTRKAFDTVAGFQGIDHIASGDDMLLMYKIEKSFPGSLSYLKNKEAIVYTEPMSTLTSFFHQRIRWASKASHFKDKRIVAVLALVLMYNLHFLVGTVLAFLFPQLWIYLLLALLAKIVIEFIFVRSLARFFGLQKELLFFPILQFLHIPYIVVSGFLGQAGPYQWKGRRVH